MPRRRDRSLSFKLAGTNGLIRRYYPYHTKYGAWRRHKVEMAGSNIYSGWGEGSEVVSLARLRLVLQVAKLKALLRIFWNQVVSSSGSILQLKSSSNLIQISQMQISRLRPIINGDKETTYIADYSTEDIKSI